MPFAYWCVLIAALLPNAIVTYAKVGSDHNNNYPRDNIDKLAASQRRAYAAHLNAFENFPFFAAAVIVAATMGAPIHVVNILAGIYIALRIAHVVFYVTDSPTARSAAFTGGLLVNIAIFVAPVFS